jgi:DNA-binding SARP family transcriptional activator
LHRLRICSGSAQATSKKHPFVHALPDRWSINMHVRVHVLGGCAVSAGAGRTLALAGPYRAVIGYVLAHRNRSVQRDELAGCVWAESDGAHARRCLSTTIWRMRKTLPDAPPLLTLEGDSLSFNWRAPAWVDAVAMELRLLPFRRRQPESLGMPDLRRIERAVRLYRGDFLAGIDDEWALIERQRLRNLYVDALYGLTLGHAAHLNWQEAVAAGRHLTAEEPLREDVHRLLMQGYVALGNRAKSIAQYQACERRLRDEIGVPPMPETVALYREIAGATAPPRGQARPVQDSLAEVRRQVTRAKRALLLVERRLDLTLAALDRPGDRTPRS